MDIGQIAAQNMSVGGGIMCVGFVDTGENQA
jgi:hypothetical protein